MKRRSKKVKDNHPGVPIMSKPENFIGKYAYAVILFLCLAVFGQSLGFGLVYCDDYEIIVRDAERLTEGGSYARELMSGYMTTDYYRPVVNMSFLLNSQIGGQGEFVYHLTNLVLHCITSCLLFLLLARLKIARPLSAIGAIVFAVHPLFANAVAWIVGRNDLLYSLFIILAMIFLVNFKDSNKKIFMALHLISFLLASFSKETALAFPVVFAAYLLFIRKEKIFAQWNLLLAAGWSFVIGLWLLLRSMAELGENINRTGLEVFLSNLPVIPEFIAKFIFPFDLSVLPTYSPFNTAAGLVIIAVLFAVSFKLQRRNTGLLLFGLVWFLVLTLPGMFVTLHNAHEWNQYLECRAYLPSAGLIVLLLGLVPEKFLNSAKGTVAVLSILAIFSIAAFIETGNYKDEIAFYESAVADSPDRARMHDILARKYLLHNEYEKAGEHFVLSYECNPQNSQYSYNTGSYYFNMKQYGKALYYLKKNIELNDTARNARIVLADAYFNLRDYTNAIAVIREYLRRWPDDADGLFSITGIYVNMKDFDNALLYAGRLAKTGKKTEDLFNMLYGWAEYYYKNEDYGPAVRLLEKAAEIMPNNPEPKRMLLDYYQNNTLDSEKARTTKDKTTNGK